MRPLQLPPLPRFGASAQSRSQSTRANVRASSAVGRPVAIQLRVAPGAVPMHPPRAVASSDPSSAFSFSEFVRALQTAAPDGTTIEVEAFCATPPVKREAEAAPVSVPVPTPAQAARATPLVPSATPEETMRDHWAASDRSAISVATPTADEAADLDAIRRAAGGGVAPPASAPPVPTPSVAQSRQRPNVVPPSEHPHNVFDRMALATTFDLGTVALERRFRDMDAELDHELSRAASRVARATAQSTVDDRTLSEDLATLRASPPLVAFSSSAPPADSAVTTAAIPLAPGTGGQSIDVVALAPGDIVISTVTSHPGSAAIRMVTGSPVSHGLLYLGNGEIAEAIETGVVVRSIHDAVAGSDLAVAFRLPELTPEQAAQVTEFARTHQGKPFNFFGLVRHAVFRLDEAIYCRNKTGTDRDRCRAWLGGVLLGPGNTDSFICSQLILEAYRQAGVPLTTTPPIWTAPGDVAELALSTPWAYVGHLKAPIPR